MHTYLSYRWFGLVWFEPDLNELRSNPTQFAEYSYGQYLKWYWLSIKRTDFAQCAVVRTDRLFRPILTVCHFIRI